MEREKSKWGVNLEWRKESSPLQNGRALVGRVLSKTKIGYGTVREAISAAWKLKGEVSIRQVGFNHYSFTFDDQTEAERILKESPWIVRNNILSLSKRKPFISDNEVQVNYCEFWVQFHNLSPEARIEANIRMMAELIGRVIEIESPDDVRFSHRNFGRARVEIEVDKPLVPGFLAPRPDNLEDVWIRVKYEKLIRFCFSCGRLVHESRVCDEEEEGMGAGYDMSMCVQALRDAYSSATSRSQQRPLERTPTLGEGNSHDDMHGSTCVESCRERNQETQSRSEGRQIH